MVWFLYFLNVYSNLNQLLSIVWSIQIIFTCCLMIVAGIAAFAGDFDEVIEFFQKHHKRLYVKSFIWTLCILSACSIVLPDPKTVGAMYVLPKIIHNQDVKALSATSVKAAEKYLNNYINAQIKEN